MKRLEEIKPALGRLIRYIEDEQFRGYDPYDGLESPLFRLPLLNSSLKFQFLFQQLIKRSPVNLRPLLGIRKGVNPVTLGLALQAYTDLFKNTEDKNYLLNASSLLEQLKNLRSEGFYGDCWGYNFRWSSRYALIPAGQPTVVATGIIINGVYSYWKVTRDKQAEEMILNAAEFVTRSLYRTNDLDGICFSYSPFDQEQVFNASMKGARILAQAYSISNETEYKNLAYQATHWLCKKQDSNGAWKYSLSKAGTKTDNYHTGYILDCLHECIQLCALEQFIPQLEKARNYYIRNFFTGEGQPKFYNNNIWPADCTAAAQSILSLCLMHREDDALKTAEWTVKNMQAENGSFYFRKFPSYTERTSFMRWSNAWMMAALCRLQFVLEKGGVHA